MPKWTGPEIIKCAHENETLNFDYLKDPESQSSSPYTIETHFLPRLVRIESNTYLYTRRFLFTHQGNKVTCDVNPYTLEAELAHLIARNICYTINDKCQSLIDILATHIKIYLENLNIESKAAEKFQNSYASASDQSALNTVAKAMQEVQESIMEDWKKYATQEIVQPSIADLSRKLPGMDTPITTEMRVGVHCVSCFPIYMTTVMWEFIQHLNDRHKWTREKIADWLDELHDSGKINIEFESWKDETNADDSPREVNGEGSGNQGEGPVFH